MPSPYALQTLSLRSLNFGKNPRYSSPKYQTNHASKTHMQLKFDLQIIFMIK